MLSTCPCSSTHLNREGDTKPPPVLFASASFPLGPWLHMQHSTQNRSRPLAPLAWPWQAGSAPAKGEHRTWPRGGPTLESPGPHARACCWSRSKILVFGHITGQALLHSDHTPMSASIRPSRTTLSILTSQRYHVKGPEF